MENASWPQAIRPDGLSETDKILLALSELDKWKARREKAANERDIEATDRQIEYYEALLRDMKRELHPPGLRTLLRHI